MLSKLVNYGDDESVPERACKCPKIDIIRTRHKWVHFQTVEAKIKTLTEMGSGCKPYMKHQFD